MRISDWSSDVCSSDLLPLPERYACHKLIVAQRRSADRRDKAAKDLAQAEALLTILLEDRPDDVADAWADLLARGPAWRHAALASHRRLPAEIRVRLEIGRAHV